MKPSAARFGAPVIEPPGSVALEEVREARPGAEASPRPSTRGGGGGGSSAPSGTRARVRSPPRRPARGRSGSGRRSSGARRRPSPTRGGRRAPPRPSRRGVAATVPLIGRRGDPPRGGVDVEEELRRVRDDRERPRGRRRSRRGPGCRSRGGRRARRGGTATVAADPPRQVRLVDVASRDPVPDRLHRFRPLPRPRLLGGSSPPASSPRPTAMPGSSARAGVPRALRAVGSSKRPNQARGVAGGRKSSRDPSSATPGFVRQEARGDPLGPARCGDLVQPREEGRQVVGPARGDLHGPREARRGRAATGSRQPGPRRRDGGEGTLG